MRVQKKHTFWLIFIFNKNILGILVKCGGV